MKVRTISRVEEDYTKERSQDLTKVHRNLDPALHQMQRAHEYVRALNAVKLEKARLGQRNYPVMTCLFKGLLSIARISKKTKQDNTKKIAAALFLRHRRCLQSHSSQQWTATRTACTASRATRSP